ncbi:MAG: HAD-IIIA family hydrolase [Saprospiraceae bacterium]|nr:HAD-IIIA family hydrolase [Saprospiraceae bacterium]MBK8667996.1 HAD-IIIA family hydrolase [Saprospiraceae bacterium]
MQSKIPFSWPNFKISSDWTLFLDRDGVINERLPDDYIKTWEEFIFLSGVLEALSIFSLFFQRIFIVTNQAGIEKGVISHEGLHEIHDKMMEIIMYHGGRIDEIYYCPFKADLDPLCRKPNPGMALQAKKDYPEINFSKAIMVGDSDSDIAFGNNLGMKTILVGAKADNTFANPNTIPDFRLDSLFDLATYLKSL